jgi:hypothetical protein
MPVICSTFKAEGGPDEAQAAIKNSTPTMVITNFIFIRQLLLF